MNTETEILTFINPIFEDEDDQNQSQDSIDIIPTKGEIKAAQNGTLSTLPNCPYFFLKGRCPFGSYCMYGHGNAYRLSHHHNTGSSAAMDSEKKTVICKNFEEHGYCKFGKKCQFLHIKSESESQNGEKLTYEELLDQIAAIWNPEMADINNSIATTEQKNERVQGNRLRKLSTMEEGFEEAVDWKYKKPRLYSM